MTVGNFWSLGSSYVRIGIACLLLSKMRNEGGRHSAILDPNRQEPDLPLARSILQCLRSTTLTTRWFPFAGPDGHRGSLTTSYAPYEGFDQLLDPLWDRFRAEMLFEGLQQNGVRCR